METMKFVINELNKEPFNKGLNLVSYDSLRGDQRLEIVIQVLKEIDAKVRNFLFLSKFSLIKN